MVGFWWIQAKSKKEELVRPEINGAIGKSLSMSERRQLEEQFSRRGDVGCQRLLQFQGSRTPMGSTLTLLKRLRVL